MAYLLRLEHDDKGKPDFYSLDDFPIRVGRNGLNEVVLNEPFVSQFHGIFTCDGGAIRYRDLGSTNGSLLNGERIAATQAHPFRTNHEDKVSIGPVHISIASSSVEGNWTSITTRARTHAFDLKRAGGKATFAMPSSATTALDRATFVLGHAAEAENAIDDEALADAARRIGPAVQGLRKASQMVEAGVLELLRTRTKAEQEAILAHLIQVFPELAKEARVHKIIANAELDLGAAHPVDLLSWLERLRTPAGEYAGTGSQADGVEISEALAMERVGAVLVSMSTAFINMQNAYVDFTSELGINAQIGSAPVDKAKDGAELLAYLLDWNADGGQTISDLEDAYTRLAIHQVAMMNAVVSGVRSLLEEVSPSGEPKERNDTSMSVQMRKKESVIERIFPFKKARLWRAFSDRYEALFEEDRFVKIVFGKRFARTYMGVAGGALEARKDASITFRKPES